MCENEFKIAIAVPAIIGIGALIAYPLNFIIAGINVPNAEVITLRILIGRAIKSHESAINAGINFMFMRVFIKRF